MLVEITWTQVGCYYPQLACAWRSLRLAALPPRTFELPTRNGITLPARFQGLRWRPSKVKQTGLRSGIGINAKGVVVLPSDVQASGKAHDTDRAVCPALFAGGFVFSRIPAISGLAAFRVRSLGATSTYSRSVLGDGRDSTTTRIRSR